MYNEGSRESPSIPDLDRTIVTDDNDQSDNSEVGRNEGLEVPIEYSLASLHHHESRHAVPYEPALEQVTQHEHRDRFAEKYTTEVEHTKSPPDVSTEFYPHDNCSTPPKAQRKTVSQETSAEDGECKEEIIPLMDPHDISHNLDDPAIDDSPIRVTVHEPGPRCVICCLDNGKPLLRFHPVDHDLLVSAAAPSVNTFMMDLSLHVFCGRTASILPNINRPELEILPKAGIKNKHGIGQEVNAALARTRFAVLNEPGSKEKCFYLVREFEANLAAVRHTYVQYHQPIDMAPMMLGNYFPVDGQVQMMHHQAPPVIEQQIEAFMDMQREEIREVESPPRKKAKNGAPQYPKQVCPCGGSYSTPSSWRNHSQTRRHLRWEEDCLREA